MTILAAIPPRMQRSATASPSTLGIFASRINKPGRGSSSSRAASAAAPESTATGSRPHARTMRVRMARTVALSSAISTRVPQELPGYGHARRGRRAAGRMEPGGEMERAAAAHLALDPDRARPSVATSREEIVRPRPVPPYFRVVEPSACANASKIEPLLLGRDADAGVDDAEVELDVLAGPRRTGRSAACHGVLHSTRTTTSPASVNLIGVADQVDQHLPQAAAGRRPALRHVRRDVVGQLQPLLVRPERQRSSWRRRRCSRGRTSTGSSVQLARLDLREVEDVVDDRQQRVGRDFDHLEVLALLAGAARCRAPARSCR